MRGATAFRAPGAVVQRPADVVKGSVGVSGAAEQRWSPMGSMGRPICSVSTSMLSEQSTE